MTMRMRCWALAVAMTMALAGGVKGQTTAVGPQLDDASLEPATARGNELLAKAKWRAALRNSGTRMAVAGPWLVCTGGLEGTTAKGALDVRTGEVLWEVKGSPETEMMVGSDAGIDFCEARSGALLCNRMAKETGAVTELWRAELAEAPAGFWVLMPGGVIAGEQILVGGAYATLERGSIMGRPPAAAMSIRSLERKTGKVRWATPVEGGAAAAVVTAAPGRVYALVDLVAGGSAAAKSYVLALNDADGKVLWRSPTEGVRQFPPVAVGGLVITGTDKGEMVALDEQTGKERWRRAISAECDAAKSKIGTMVISTGRLYVDKDLVLAPVTLPPVGAAGGANRDRSAEVEQIFGAMAAFEVQSGKQVGYFGGIKRTQRPLVTPLEFLAVQNGMIFARMARSCLGINRKTMQLECYIKATAATAADGVMYVNTKFSPNAFDTGGDIHAVPLGAWAGGKGAD
jgi:hypothetical protein